MALVKCRLKRGAVLRSGGFHEWSPVAGKDGVDLNIKYLEYAHIKGNKFIEILDDVPEEEKTESTETLTAEQVIQMPVEELVKDGTNVLVKLNGIELDVNVQQLNEVDGKTYLKGKAVQKYLDAVANA